MTVFSTRYNATIETDIDTLLSLLDEEETISNGTQQIYNVPMSFDIETTTMIRDGEKMAWMYVWMFAIRDHVFIGRTWPEFTQLIHKLNKKPARSIVYIHNLAYEFGFMRKLFRKGSVFLIDNQTPVKFRTGKIEFKCSLLESGMSLENLAADMREIGATNRHKMLGDLDYRIIRHAGTKLTEEELGYCINDVLILTDYIQHMIEQRGGINRILLTKTAYVREYVRGVCFGDAEPQKTPYHNKIKNLTIEAEEYDLLKNAFAGGYTHSNPLNTDHVFRNVHSRDFASSYPAVMLAEKFPMGKGREITIRTLDDFKKARRGHCLIFEIVLKDLKPASVTVGDYYLSESKCKTRGFVEVANGRIASAEKLYTVITDVDFDTISQCYEFDPDAVQFGRCYSYTADYLPREIFQAVLQLYADKTNLKGNKEKIVAYNIAKAMLNSIYGMCVTAIIRDILRYDFESGEYPKPEPADVTKELRKYNEKRDRFLFYPWGVFITAYARRNLWTGILQLGGDYIYSDTDSLKYLNEDKHKPYFDAYNDMIRSKIDRALLHYGFDPEDARPRGKQIGEWSREPDMEHFKTLGAKRYIYTERDEKGDLILHSTVAGVSKKKLPQRLTGNRSGKIYSERHAMKVMEVFCEGLHVSGEWSGKLTHGYHGNAFEAIVTDYQGNTRQVEELSYITLEPAEYNLSIADEYLNFLKGIKEKAFAVR